MSNLALLHKLRNNPTALTTTDVQADLVKGFLNPWSCRLKNDQTTATNIRKALIQIQPFLAAIANCNLRDNLSQTIQVVGHKNKTLEKSIAICYATLFCCSKGFAKTATSKLLHVLNPELFVMWDDPILAHFQKTNSLIDNSAQGYCRFHQSMQLLLTSADEDFARTTLAPKSLTGQSVESYLTQQLNMSIPLTPAKLVDEYNWVVFTKEATVPPIWHP
ncbi:hypothetical protein JYU19_01885 [bacterium AH-315-J21]|nr:hypothetical protein [bacterium AH-315-J21]